jgi:two-component system sensor histidine kinase UhpB
LKKNLLFISFLYSLIAFSQTNTIDSLARVLQIQKEDSNKINILSAIATKISWEGDQVKALEYAQKALILSQKLKLKSKIAQSYAGLSAVYGNMDDRPNAIKRRYLALKIFEQIGDKKQSADCLAWIGFNNYCLENYEQSFSAYSSALKMYQQIGSDKCFGIGFCYVYLANIYRVQVKYPEALDYSYKGLKIAIEIGDKLLAANAYFSIGDILSLKIGNPHSTKNNAEKSLLKEALKNYFEALNNFKAVGNTGGVGDNYKAVAETYSKLHQFLQAQKYADSAFLIAKRISGKDNLKNAYLVQTKIDSAKGDYQHAFEHHKLYILYRDSLINEENAKRSFQSKMQYEFDKKQNSAKAEQGKKDVLAAAELKNQILIRNFSIAGIFLVASFGGYSFYRYRRRRKLQSEQEMLNERLRISRELHDDMGSTLGSISIYSEVAKNRSVKNENADEVILKIGAASRELIDKMSDIVWSINPNNESIEQLQNRMQTFAAMILTPHNIQYHFLADDAIQKVKLTAEERKNIFLIFKEAIHNIVKYAECKNVEISLSQQSDHLEMIIKDDGKGFDISKLPEADSLGGNGIKNMKARTETMNATININSKINEGTTIELKLNI